MTQLYRSGAVGGLMDVYEKVITELLQSVAAVKDGELLMTIDSNETARFHTIQSVLAHVVKAGYCYAVDIRRLRGTAASYPDTTNHSSAAACCKALEEMFTYTLETFADIKDDELEAADNSKKIISSWGQVYDIEQITEHAIAHILRHHRQIEKMKQQIQIYR